MTIASQYSYQKPLTGFNIAIPNFADKLILDPAGTLAAGTIVMPAYPIPGQRVKIFSTTAVTSITHSAAASQTLVGAITSLTANVLGGTWEWCAETQTWYPS